MHAHCAGEKWRVKCISLQLPSVTVDRHRLSTKPTATKKRWSDLLKNYELHQLLDVSDQNPLEEECHILYCCGDIGSANSSPDSRWRRFFRETVARKSGRSRIGAFLPDFFTVRYHCPWYLLNSSSETCDLALQIRPSLWTFARSSQLRVVIHDRLGLWESEREYIWNVHFESQLFCSISSTHSRLYGTLSVLQFCRVEHHGNALSWSRSAG